MSPHELGDGWLSILDRLVDVLQVALLTWIGRGVAGNGSRTVTAPSKRRDP